MDEIKKNLRRASDAIQHEIEHVQEVIQHDIDLIEDKIDYAPEEIQTFLAEHLDVGGKGKKGDKKSSDRKSWKGSIKKKKHTGNSTGSDDGEEKKTDQHQLALIGAGDYSDSDSTASTPAATNRHRPATAEESSLDLVEQRASSAQEILEMRRKQKELNRLAEEAFVPRRDAIDSLILDVQLSSAQPKHMSNVVESAARRKAPSAATGLANYARGSMSSKAGSVNKMERKAMVELGAIKPLSDSLDEALGEYLCTCCADALANLAIDNECREAVGSSDAIENLVNILGNAAHPDSDKSARQSALCEHAAACLRNLALDENNSRKMARCGAIPALITLTNDGSPVTRGMSACTLACIAKSKDKCEQICDYGAAQGLLRMLEMKEEVCQLSSAGCLNELSRLKRNKFKISHNSGYEVLNRVLLRKMQGDEGDFLLQMVQEKAILVLLNLVEEPQLQKKAVKKGVISTSIIHLSKGSNLGKEAAAWILCHLTSSLTDDQRKETAIPIAKMIGCDTWSVKSTGCKAIMKIFRTDEEKMYFVKMAEGLKHLCTMLQEREPRLHENTLGAILALMENPEVPDMLLEVDGLNIVPKLVRMLEAANLVVRRLTFGILKCLSIYDNVLVHEKIPLQHHYYIEHPPDEFVDYIKMFVDKRKERGYLSRVAKMGEKFTENELKEYQALFTELDEDSSGSIDAEEIGLLVEALGGKKLPEDELQQMVDEVDKDGSGVIEWDEFLVIMWNLKNGKKTGLGGLLGNALSKGFKRSALGKGLNKMSRYYNRKKIEMEELMDAELKEQREAEERARLAEKYWEAERLKRERLRHEQKLLKQT